MSPEVATIERTLKNVEGLTDSYVDLTGGRIDQINEALDLHIHTLEKIINLRVARVETALMGPVALIYKNAVYHTLRAYFHASPSLITLLAAIWGAIKVVWTAIQWVLSFVQVLQDLKLFELLAAIWPAFKEARDQFRRWVGELSEAIGWGVDGLLHLLHATQGFTDVLGGLTGRSYTWMDAAWMVKTGNVLNNISKYADQIGDDPGKILEILFQGELRKSLPHFLHFGNELTTKIWNITKDTTKALSGLSDVVDELTAIQENMPELIRANIPESIWTSLESFSDTISTQILPRLHQVENALKIFNTVFANNSKKISDLSDRLAHPGTNLLTIDDLPDYVRFGEQLALDEVTSRLFGEGADGDRSDMQSDLDRFDIIDQAAKSPLPPLPFMDIETPGRAALHGIVVEPQETWFIGGYDSQL